MKKLLLTFAVLLGFALPGLAANLVFDFSSNKPSWMPSGSNFSQVTKTAPNGIDVTFAKNSYYNTTGYLMIKTNSSVTISPNINFKEINVTTSNSIGSTAKMSIKLGNTLYGSDKAIGTKNTTFTFTNESVTNANTEVSFNATTGNSQIVKIEFVEAEPTGPQDFEPSFKDKAYSIFKGETLDVNSLITVNTPPSVTYVLPEGTTAIEQTSNGVFVGKEATAAPVTVTASWEAVADKWNAGSATFTINVTKKPDFIVDVLNVDFFNITNSYKAYEKASNVTNIKYSAFAFKDNGIQMNPTRNDNNKYNCGIIVKDNPNGYTLGKVEIVWHDTSGEKQIGVYGKEIAYTANSQMYEEANKGTYQTSLTSSSAEYQMTNDYKFIGLVPEKGNNRVTSITLYWIAPEAPQAPEFTLDPTEEGAEYTDISNYGHSVTIAREEGVTYTYRLNEEEIEKELAENLILTPGAESGIGFGTINNLTVIAKKGKQTVESEKAYFLTHPYASVSEGKIKLTSVAPAEHNVKIYYTIIDSAESQAIRATRAARTEYTVPVKLENGQKIQYWAEAAHPVNAGETLKSAVVTNSLKDDGSLVGVDSIEADENAPVEFYTIDGLRVAEPENGLYIVRQGNKVYKVVIRK